MSTHASTTYKHYGWQQAALPIVKKAHRMVCHHIGLVWAQHQMDRHAVGHEWVCSCGQTFVVVVKHGHKAMVKELVS